MKQLDHATEARIDFSNVVDEVKQTSEKWGISVRRIQVLCTEDRIPGATRIGSYWAIPADAEKSVDQRIKSGKYIKKDDKL